MISDLFDEEILDNIDLDIAHLIRLLEDLIDGPHPGLAIKKIVELFSKKRLCAMCKHSLPRICFHESSIICNGCKKIEISKLRNKLDTYRINSDTDRDVITEFISALECIKDNSGSNAARIAEHALNRYKDRDDNQSKEA